MTTSITDVRTAFTRMASAARWAGVDTTDLAMQEGRSNGIAFRVYVLDRESGGHSTWPYGEIMGYIGSTRAEAIATLDTMTRVFNGFAIERKAQNV